MPEPLAIPPTRNVPFALTISMAASLGNGSVVMMPSAASPPPVGESAAAAMVMPRSTLAMSSFTPMTPVDATSTDDGSTPSVAAVRSAIALAWVIPSTPVQALAQPLLTTIAAAWPPDAASRLRDTRIGAAWARLVVNTAAAGTGRSAATRVRSCLPEALMPHATPAARKPPGAVMPPSIGVISMALTPARPHADRPRGRYSECARADVRCWDDAARCCGCPGSPRRAARAGR